MVFSDDFLHFLKINKKKKNPIYQNYLVALKAKTDIPIFHQFEIFVIKAAEKQTKI